MSLDASLRTNNAKGGARNVLTRAERIKQLLGEERWTEENGVLHLPKVRVKKSALKKPKKEKKAEEPAAGKAAKAPKK